MSQFILHIGSGTTTDIFFERARELIAAGSPKKPAFWGALQVVDIVVHIIPHDEDAAGGMLGFGAAMEAYSAALWHILHDWQEAAELR